MRMMAGLIGWGSRTVVSDNFEALGWSVGMAIAFMRHSDERVDCHDLGVSWRSLCMGNYLGPRGERSGGNSVDDETASHSVGGRKERGRIVSMRLKRELVDASSQLQLPLACS